MFLNKIIFKNNLKIIIYLKRSLGYILIYFYWNPSDSLDQPISGR